MSNKNLNLANYLLYLDIIMSKLSKFFESQSEYIFCKKGCAKCCEHAQFPYTEIEFLLLMEGYKLLKSQYKKIVDYNISEILNLKKDHYKNSSGEKFRYQCPFLINNECSVYNFRGLICRCFGLMTYDKNNKKSPMVPFCAYEGLNYSNVLNTETNKISPEMYRNHNLIKEPTAFNVSYPVLIDDEIAEKFDFEFGESKPLVDWLEVSFK